MSHIATIAVKPRDKTAIAAACTRLGWQLVEKSTFKWYGRDVGDFREFTEQLRQLGIEPKDYGKCDFAVSVPGSPYEIGFVQVGAEYVPYWDFYRGLTKDQLTKQVQCPDGQMMSFMQAYACEAAKIQARKKGMASTETRLSDGSIKVTINAR